MNIPLGTLMNRYPILKTCHYFKDQDVWRIMIGSDTNQLPMEILWIRGQEISQMFHEQSDENPSLYFEY